MLLVEGEGGGEENNTPYHDHLRMILVMLKWL